MKNCILFLSLICAMTIKAQNAESIKVQYKIETDATREIENENPVIKKLLRETRQNISEMIFELFANKESSIFYLKSNMSKDYNDRVYAIAKAQVKGKYTYYRDKEIKLIYGEFFGEEMIIKEEMSKYNNWKISKETKNILGFKCFKASTEYSSIDKKGEKIIIPIEVWFTSDIPISAGPSGIYGLPGLILEGYLNSVFIYKADKIEFNPSDFQVEKPKAKIVLTEEEFESKVKEALDRIHKN